MLNRREMVLLSASALATALTACDEKKSKAKEDDDDDDKKKRRKKKKKKKREETKTEGSDHVEVTKVDFTTLPDFSAAKVSVFGVYIGMGTLDARAKIENNEKLLRENRSMAGSAVYTKKDGKKGDNVAGIDHPGKVERLMMYKRIAPMLVGRAAKLFEADAFKNDAELAKWLGKPDRTEKDKYDADLFFFDKRGIKLRQNEYGVMVTFYVPEATKPSSTK